MRTRGTQGNRLTELLGLSQGWRQNFSDRGAGASDRGAKKTEKWCFRPLFAKVPPTRTKIFVPPTRTKGPNHQVHLRKCSCFFPCKFCFILDVRSFHSSNM